MRSASISRIFAHALPRTWHSRRSRIVDLAAGPDHNRLDARSSSFRYRMTLSKAAAAAAAAAGEPANIIQIVSRTSDVGDAACVLCARTSARAWCGFERANGSSLGDPVRQLFVLLTFARPLPVRKPLFASARSCYCRIEGALALPRESFDPEIRTLR